jgi:REP element-mobilizing transposase RayT
MTYDPLRHHRRSVRMPGHDYGQGGVYLVTICTQDRDCRFGDVVGDSMCPNDAGAMVEATWKEAAAVCRGVETESFQLMPNHIHALLVIASGSTEPSALRVTSLPEFVRRFKTMTMKRYAGGVRADRWPAFRHRLWQRGYHEHLVRNDHARQRILGYIAANPSRWMSDSENPAAVPQ